MKRFLIFSILLMSLVTQAQFEDIFASQGDANKFVTNYTDPLFRGLTYATNASWVTSAQPIKAFHIELNIGASGAFVPKQNETFKFDPDEYQYLRIENGPDMIPTVMGGESQTRMKIVIPINNNEIKILEFNAPGGVKDQLPMNVVPAPVVQASMGLPLGSEINVRYAPKLTNKDGGFFQLLGIGIKHSLTQYFSKKENKEKRKFNLAAHVSYQNILAGYDDPDSNKSVHFSINTVSLQGVASLDYKLISLYSALGYTRGFSSMDVLGTYSYTYDIQDNNGNSLGTQTVSVNDPLQLDYNMNAFKAKAGFKLKLTFFQIFADYTIQEFPVATAGIGFMF